MKSLFNYCGFWLFVVSVLQAQIKITEVMYDLAGSDSPNEFVEFFNPSETDTIDLSGYTIRDQYTTDVLEDSGDGMILLPNQYGLIFEGDYDFENGIYASIVPDSVVKIKVDDSSIGNGLSASDSLYLVDSTGMVVDSLGWTDIADPGFSIERIRLYRPNLPWNWTASLDSLGTPGRPNSVLPYQIDGAILSISAALIPDTLSPGETLTTSVTLSNPGVQTVAGTLHVLTDSVETNIIPISGVTELDTISEPLTLGPFASGYHTVILQWNIPGDADESNNTVSTFEAARFLPGDVQLNEFLPAPTGEQSEFVEIVPRLEIDLYRWAFTDNRFGHYSRILNHDLVNENQFTVLAADSEAAEFVPDSAVFLVPDSWSSLNNSGDAVRLLDPFGTLIDSLAYSAAWGLESGQSMEKRLEELPSADSVNWAVCIDSTGWTPGQKNSVHPENSDGALIGMQFAMDKNPPDSLTSITVRIEVTNPGLTTITGTWQVQEGDQTVGNGIIPTLGAGDSLSLTTDIGVFPPGNHDLEALLLIDGDQNPDNNQMSDTLKIRYPFAALRINEFFPIPNNDQTEFVEVAPSRNLDLTGWSLADNRKEPAALSAIHVTKNDLPVIASDSTILGRIPNGTEVIILNSAFPSLNNSGDAIYLFDQTGSVIDSVVYTTEWPLESERSVEKISPAFPSDDPASWKTCIAPEGETPGQPNSVLLAHRDGTILPELRMNPEFPEPHETMVCTVRVVNHGIDAVSGSVSVECNDEELDEEPVSSLERLDTANIALSISLPESGPNQLSFYFNVSGEESAWDNGLINTVWVRYPVGCVTLNEFLAIPDSSMGEFVECILNNNIVTGEWTISDGTHLGNITDFGGNAGDYVVLAQDSSLADRGVENLLVVDGWPSLNNSGESIILRDPTGKSIDSITYNEDNWPLMNGRSTEKFRPDYPAADPRSWGLSIAEEGMTPGLPNSIEVDSLAEKSNIVYDPDPFSPDGDGHDDLLYIHYHLAFQQSVLTIEIYDAAGRLIASPAVKLMVGSDGVLTWDGNRKNKSPARIGLYLVKAKAEDTQSSKVWDNLQTIVLAGYLR